MKKKEITEDNPLSGGSYLKGSGPPLKKEKTEVEEMAVKEEFIDDEYYELDSKTEIVDHIKTENLDF